MTSSESNGIPAWLWLAGAVLLVLLVTVVLAPEESLGQNFKDVGNPIISALIGLWGGLLYHRLDTKKSMNELVKKSARTSISLKDGVEKIYVDINTATTRLGEVNSRSTAFNDARSALSSAEGSAHRVIATAYQAVREWEDISKVAVKQAQDETTADVQLIGQRQRIQRGPTTP